MPTGQTENLLTVLPSPVLQDDHMIVGRGGQLYQADKRLIINPAPLIRAVARPQLADFGTWLNQLTCVGTDEDYGFSLYAPPRGSGDSLNARYRNVPAGGHFSVMAGIYLNASFKGNLAAGIFLREAATGRLELLSIGAASNTGTATEKWSSPTGGRSTRQSVNGQITKAYLKYIVGGNWISPQISFDGVHFFQFSDPFLIRDFLNGAIDHWGMYVNCNNSGTPNGDVSAFMFHYEESIADNLTSYPSYMNRYGSGPRTSSVVVTTDATVTGAAITTLVDGDYLGDLSKPRFAADATGNRQITFQFPTAVKITEAKFFMNSPNAEGTWRWQGSNSGGSWTDISATWTLTGDFDGEPIGDLSTNTTAFSYYRMQQTAGSLDSASALRQIDFKVLN